MASTDTLLWWLLGAALFPLWLLSGVADYLCHARTDLAHTSGRHEAALHLLQLAEIGAPLLAFLFLEVDALVLTLLLVGVVAHTLSAWRDLRYTAHRREITPAEQFVHGPLLMLPWVALALIAILHWPVLHALADPAIASDWRPHLRRPMFPAPIVAGVLAAAGALALLPGLWEFARAMAAQASSSSARSPTKPR